MIAIPEARENMTKGEVRKLLVELADAWNEREGKCASYDPEIHPLETHVQDRMEEGLQNANAPRIAKWHRDPRFPKRLVDRQGIQQDILKLNEEEIRQIQEDDASLLDNAGK